TLIGALLKIDNFVFVTGDLSFEKGAPLFVTPHGAGSPVEVSVMKIGISGVKAFVGTGGPYWVTESHGTVRAPTSTAAGSSLGLAISNCSLGLVILKPADAADTRSYMALKASGSAQLVGIQSVQLSATMTVSVNRASDSNTSHAAPDAIDFTQL